MSDRQKFNYLLGKAMSYILPVLGLALVELVCLAHIFLK